MGMVCTHLISPTASGSSNKNTVHVPGTNVLIERLCLCSCFIRVGLLYMQGYFYTKLAYWILHATWYAIWNWTSGNIWTVSHRSCVGLHMCQVQPACGAKIWLVHSFSVCDLLPWTVLSDCNRDFTTKVIISQDNIHFWN